MLLLLLAGMQRYACGERARARARACLCAAWWEKGWGRSSVGRIAIDEDVLGRLFAFRVFITPVSFVVTKFTFAKESFDAWRQDQV